MQTHAPFAYAAVGRLTACGFAFFLCFKGLDSIAESPPRFAGVGSRGDARADRGGDQGGEKWVIANEWVVLAFESPFFE